MTAKTLRARHRIGMGALMVSDMDDMRLAYRWIVPALEEWRKLIPDTLSQDWKFGVLSGTGGFTREIGPYNDEIKISRQILTRKMTGGVVRPETETRLRVTVWMRRQVGNMSVRTEDKGIVLASMTWQMADKHQRTMTEKGLDAFMVSGMKYLFGKTHERLTADGLPV